MRFSIRGPTVLFALLVTAAFVAAPSPAQASPSVPMQVDEPSVPVSAVAVYDLSAFLQVSRAAEAAAAPSATPTFAVAAIVPTSGHARATHNRTLRSTVGLQASAANRKRQRG